MGPVAWLWGRSGGMRLWSGCGVAVRGALVKLPILEKTSKNHGFCIIFASDRPPGGKFFLFFFFLVPQKIETKLTNNDRQLHWQPGGPLSDTPCGGKPLGGFYQLGSAIPPRGWVVGQLVWGICGRRQCKLPWLL